jgi:predicted ATPase
MIRQQDRTSFASSICFAPFRLDLTTEQLWCGAERLAVRPKTFAVLRYLVEHPGRLVTRDELCQAVWPETVGSERAPKQCIRELRQVLGEEPATPRVIETIARRGWRFIGTVDTSLQSRDSGEEKERQKAKRNKQQAKINSEDAAPNTKHLTPFLVGRETELSQLHTRLDKARNGARQIVFITGEPGIGKTTLVDAFLQILDRKQPTRDEKMWLGRGQCIEQHGSGEAFLPVLDALGRLARGTGGTQLIELLRTYAPMWLVQLPAFIDDKELETLQRKVQGASRERMLREFADMVEALTTDGSHGGAPLLLVLEDLHWSDVSTLDLLAFLARRKEPARLLVIGTYRPVEMLSDGHPLQSLTQELYAHRFAVEVALTGLSEAAVGEYVATRLRGKPSRDREGAERQPEAERETARRTDQSLADARGSDSWRALAQALYHRTGGNPLFLVSTVEELVAQGNLTQIDDAWTWQGEVADIGIAESIRQLVARQRGRLSSDERQTLEAASVAGMEFSAAAVAAALTTDTTVVERRCEQLAERQLFLRRVGIEEWPDGTLAARYGFLHAVYQEWWHEQVSPTQLQYYHRHIGERKERTYGDRAREIAAELALHFEQGRDYQRAIQYLQRAGENAVRRSANQEAITHLTKGVELLKTLPDTPERTQQELRLLRPLGPALISLKGFAAPEVEHIYARATALCQQDDRPHQLIYVLQGLQLFHLVRGEVRRARDLAEQAWRLAQRIATPTSLMTGHAFLVEPLYFLGELTAAREHLEQAWGLYNPQEHNLATIPHWVDPRVGLLCYLALTSFSLGYPDQAQQRLAEVLALAEKLNHPFSLASILVTSQ